MTEKIKKAEPLCHPLTRQRFSISLQKAFVAPVDEEALARYVPKQLDFKIVEALLYGSVTPADIARYVKCEPGAISRALRRPVRAAWISRQMANHVQHRRCLVDAALMNQILSGNMRAIELYYRLVRALDAPPATNQHIHFHDVKNLTNDDLRAIVAEKLRTAGVLDVEAGADRPAEGAGGAGAPEGGSADAGVPAPREAEFVPRKQEAPARDAGREPEREDV